MKFITLLSAFIICTALVFATNSDDIIVTFLLVGAVPGTTHSVSADTMFTLFVAAAGIVVVAISTFTIRDITHTHRLMAVQKRAQLPRRRLGNV